MLCQNSAWLSHLASPGGESETHKTFGGIEGADVTTIYKISLVRNSEGNKDNYTWQLRVQALASLPISLSLSLLLFSHDFRPNGSGSLYHGR